MLLTALEADALRSGVWVSSESLFQACRGLPSCCGFTWSIGMHACHEEAQELSNVSHSRALISSCGLHFHDFF